ncbi:MAG: hypothetical protein IPK17_00185 [Chloroflexi bacterium]|uniref:hypothetical protein n=1 Tax=Candidatus Flexifilum breve TaxID=3140694 RepID=UPI003134A769|nr:hypothetical protein [Chloroflexota bacterium]
MSAGSGGRHVRGREVEVGGTHAIFTGRATRILGGCFERTLMLDGDRGDRSKPSPASPELIDFAAGLRLLPALQISIRISAKPQLLGWNP